MELTSFERLTLINQYKILEKLHPDEADYYAKAWQILENGYALEYGRLFEHLCDGLTNEDCREVQDILNMYRALRFSFDHLDKKDGVDPAKVVFRGFDGNEEGSRYMYAEFLINTDGRWRESKSDDLNSHWPLLADYREMLTRWQESGDRNHLSREDILRIIAD